MVAGGTTVALTACAVAGGVFGFLRFNTHPARVFMGDAGSQFLGFSLAVLAVRLTQEVNPGLSMAVPALILGLPIVDILAVFAQRIYQRMNWFRASRNHIHHRLLDLGFEHYQAVIIIYSIHGAFTLMAALLAYESDFLILGIYCGGCALVFAMLWLAKRAHWSAGRVTFGTGFARWLENLHAGGKAALWPLRIVQVLVPAYFLINASAAVLLPPDSGPALGMLAAAYVIGLALSRTALGPLVLRLAVYVSAAFIVYMNQAAGSPWSGALAAINTAFFIVLVLAIAVYARFARDSDNFVPTTMDFLIMLLVVAAGLFYRNMDQSQGLGALVVQVVVLFYGCELIILHGGRRAVGVLFAATAAALAPFALQFL
jgi:UDP-GlcNAc:undecaprenyl-phosphate GlcNAc-1-phosphate transferase